MVDKPGGHHSGQFLENMEKEDKSIQADTLQQKEVGEEQR